MQQFTLSAKYYTDPELYRDEMERFFCNMWVCVGREEQIPNPGHYFLVELVNESIIVTRDTDANVRAFYNVCRHRGTRMCQEASGKFAARIQCPYHGWTYGLDGHLLGAPHMQEANFQREGYPLYSVQAEIWDGHIFLNLANSGGSLFTQLGDLPQTFAPWRMQDLRNCKTAEYEVRANWKLLIQNYNECLHCPVLHPLLNRITDYTSGENADPHPGYIGGSMEFRGEAQTMSLDGKRRRDYLPDLNEEQRKHVLYYAVYPNLFLSLHPDYVMLHRLWPLAVDRTRVVTDWLFHPTEIAKPDFQLQDVVEFWDKTNKEDWAICELSQLGISSRAYQPGPYSAREGLPQAFDRMILANERNGRQS